MYPEKAVVQPLDSEIQIKDFYEKLKKKIFEILISSKLIKVVAPRQFSYNCTSTTFIIFVI
jgi:hypothetical protein